MSGCFVVHPRKYASKRVDISYSIKVRKRFLEFANDSSPADGSKCGYQASFRSSLWRNRASEAREEQILVDGRGIWRVCHIELHRAVDFSNSPDIVVDAIYGKGSGLPRRGLERRARRLGLVGRGHAAAVAKEGAVASCKIFGLAPFY